MNCKFIALLSCAAVFSISCSTKNNPTPDPTPEDLPEMLFSESFRSGLGKFTVDTKDKGGLGKDIWFFNPDHPEYGAQASGYENSTNHKAEAWLISPEIELKAGYKDVFVRFNHAIAYANGNPLTNYIGVKVTTDGGKTWIDKPIPNNPGASSRFETVSSGDISLKPQIGKTVRIAFVYKSTTDTAPTWEIMDLEVSSVEKALDLNDKGQSYTAVPAWMELPQVAGRKDIVIHTAPLGNDNVRNYTLLYDSENLVARWVAYPLSDTYTKKNVQRTDAWAMDPFVETQAVYYRAGDIYNNGVAGSAVYNRGHQLPSADRLASTELNKQTFYFTNIAPQLADKAFNAGIWEDLEMAVRSWSASSNSTDTLYVVTGCMVDSPVEYRKDNDNKVVAVPNAFFKALLRLSKGNYIGAGFYLDHKDYSGQPVTLKEFSCSLKELEEKTGFTFFANLPADKAATVKAENPADNAFWNLK